MTKKKKILLAGAICFVLLAISIVMLVSFSFAYFRVFVDTNGVHSAMVELIFDRLDADGFAAYQAAMGTEEKYGTDFTPSAEADWGTRENPYVISQKYHVQNLSILQNNGFFENRTDENGEPIQIYFLVCNTDGTPVVIDCDGMTISPIGTHARPFTGVILGAPGTGEASYRTYGSSVSGFANLTVRTNLGEPDIGFFGRLGYYGKKNTTTNDLGEEITTVDGYAATVKDILLADVTIQSRYSIKDIIANWWATLANHQNYQDTRFETHHVGIIAGHAEFATVQDVSVYYSSDSVSAFDLISSGNTSYYSTTGLLGILDCVNPVLNSDGVLDGSNAISDSVLVGDGSSGGGGSESGTMTGYFLAKNLYDRHEEYLSKKELTTKDKYSVTEMKDSDNSDLFETVTMRERKEVGWNNWEYYNYFYFQDTVFTFAMTTKVPATQGGTVTGSAVNDLVDYIQKIWIIDEENKPSISSAQTLDKLHYGPDPTATPPVSYRLTAVSSITDKGYYVLAYHNTADNCLYLIDLTDTQGTQNYTRKIPLDNNEEIVLGIDYVNSTTDIATIYLKGIQKNIYDYAFQYVTQDDTTGSIKRPDSEYRLGITSGTDAKGDKYTSATTVVSNAANSGGDYDGTTAFVHYWSFAKESDSSNRYRITGRCTFGGRGGFLWLDTYYRYYWSKLTFDASNGSIGFVNNVYDSASERNSAYNSAVFNSNDYFTIFEVKANTYDEAGNITNEDATGNKLLASKNIFPEEPFYNFDPSKYVLQFVPGEINDASDDSYKLVPIRSLKLNNGKGELLTEINHIVKLAQTTPSNFQLTIGEALGWDGLDDYIGTNTGGVVNTTIGTKDTKAYSIPTGMIAFQLNKASEETPSYINIIVAIEPNQESVGRVGLWQIERSNWSKGFDITKPKDHFMLPVSKTATSSSDIDYAIKISERIMESEESGKKIYNVVTDTNGNKETSYIYLGGEVALVCYTFKITDISEQSIFMLGSMDGPLSVAYFSVTGAAGSGNDGMSGSPLGNVDFVYDYNGKIITTDKHYVGEAPLLDLEDYKSYYQSYLFVSMLPEENKKIQNEVVKIRRYIKTDDDSGTKRHISVTGEIYTELRRISPITEDSQDDIDS